MCLDCWSEWKRWSTLNWIKGFSLWLTFFEFYIVFDSYFKLDTWRSRELTTRINELLMGGRPLPLGNLICGDKTRLIRVSNQPGGSPLTPVQETVLWNGLNKCSFVILADLLIVSSASSTSFPHRDHYSFISSCCLSWTEGTRFWAKLMTTL